MKRSVCWLIAAGLWLFFFMEPCGAAGPRGAVPEVKAVKVSLPPQLDGDLNDKAWLQAALYGSKFSGFVNAGGTELVKYQPVVLVAYDDKKLYVGVRTYLPEIDKLRGEREEFSGSDDLVQVFLEPELDGRYVQYMVNCKGAASHPAITAAGAVDGIMWSLELAIPWKQLSIFPRQGKTIGFNVTGNQAVTGASWITWSPTYGGFHNTSRFGYLELGSKPDVAGIPTTVEEDIF